MTTIKIESNDGSVTRVVHGKKGNERETWMELIAPFFEALNGMGYYFDHSSDDLADACIKMEGK